MKQTMIMRSYKLILTGILILPVTLLTGVALAGEEKVAENTIVHTAQFDKLYHMKFCVRLKSSFNPRQLTIRAAIDKGLKPCERCKPPTSFFAVKKRPAPAPKKKAATRKPLEEAAKEPSTILFTDNLQVAANSNVKTVYRESMSNSYNPERSGRRYKTADQCVQAETQYVLRSDILEGATGNVRALLAEYIAEEACSPLMSISDRCFVQKRNRYIGNADENMDFYTVMERADRHARNACR